MYINFVRMSLNLNIVLIYYTPHLHIFVEFPNPNGFKFTIDGSRGLLASMDHAGRGILELENFCRLWRYLTQFKDIFADIDSNRCGFLNSLELRKAVRLWVHVWKIPV